MTIVHKSLLPPIAIVALFFGSCGPAAPPVRVATEHANVSRLVKPIGSTEALSGVVLRIRTLDAEELQRAVDDPRPRIVVFEVGGVIDLKGKALVVRHPHLILAGQTAPDPGITLIRGGLLVQTSHVTIQHIASRSGNAYDDDAMGARRASDVVFDHCSATWGVDENLSVSGPADADPEATSHDVTLRSCLIAEGLSHSVHAKGEHSKGTLIHDSVHNVTVEGCLYAHNEQRNPRLKGGTTTTLTSNVIYNWGSQCVGVGKAGNKKTLTPAETTLTNVVAIAGSNTRSMEMVKSVDPGARVTFIDDVAVDAHGGRLRLNDDGVIVTNVSSAPNWQIVERVLRTAGSRSSHRDPIDTRIVQSVIDGTGHIIDSQDQAGGYPTRATTTRALVVPDTHRDEWLQRLSDDLEVDRTIDITPLWKRLHITAAPSPDSRR